VIHITLPFFLIERASYVDELARRRGDIFDLIQSDTEGVEARIRHHKQTDKHTM